MASLWLSWRYGVQTAHATRQKELNELKKINWTQLNEKEYIELKSKLVSFSLNFNWTLEQYRQPAKKE